MPAVSPLFGMLEIKSVFLRFSILYKIIQVHDHNNTSDKSGSLHIICGVSLTLACPRSCFNILPSFPQHIKRKKSP